MSLPRGGGRFDWRARAWLTPKSRATAPQSAGWCDFPVRAKLNLGAAHRSDGPPGRVRKQARWSALASVMAEVENREPKGRVAQGKRPEYQYAPQGDEAHLAGRAVSQGVGWSDGSLRIARRSRESKPRSRPFAFQLMKWSVNAI